MSLDSLRVEFYYQSEFLKKEKQGGKKCHFDPKQELSYLRNARSRNPILFFSIHEILYRCKKNPQTTARSKNATDTLLCEPNASANEIFVASEGNVLDVYANCDMGLKNVSS